MKIGNTQLLDIGTPVQVQGKRGTVVKAELVQGHPYGMICLHTIRYTHRYERRQGAQKSRYVPLDKPITQQCNYAFIDTIQPTEPTTPEQLQTV